MSEMLGLDFFEAMVLMLLLFMVGMMFSLRDCITATNKHLEEIEQFTKHPELRRQWDDD
jgi:hypothetical protein|tara:strand:- start:40 stop:216 length:177 start_codon:yes stop_codon:yes gene_type:complete